MEQEPTVNRVLRDMKLRGLIMEDTEGEMRIYLKALWVAGWEHRGKELAANNNTPVILLTKEGKFLKRYPNVKQAAQKAKYARGTIYSSLKSGEPTSRGHIWKHAELKETA